MEFGIEYVQIGQDRLFGPRDTATEEVIRTGMFTSGRELIQELKTLGLGQSSEAGPIVPVIKDGQTIFHQVLFLCRPPQTEMIGHIVTRSK